VLHVGHCNRERNVLVLSLLARSGFKVILIASTSTIIDIELLSELRESGVMVLTQFIENIQHFYQMADCYVFPVIHATSAIDSPLSVLEAMACNLPVVTTRFGILPDLFQPGYGLYYTDLEQEILSMVNKAVVDQDCRTYEKVVPYTWDRVASYILKIFTEAATL
jgi:glycosyltransferase involved in cell wall biosynthesis